MLKSAKKYLLPSLLLLCFVFTGQFVFAADGGHSIDGGSLSIWWALPFVGILLSIAIMPLQAEKFWENHFGKISFFWGLLVVVPMLFIAGFQTTLYELLHLTLGEYIPFVVLLFALYTISGGVRITGHLKGTPRTNLVMMLIGTILASVMGTTGAAMLMIRPMLRANADRKYKVHMVVFFIFLVCNVGGSLTPLGDPPLFLGFLQGVNFFWTTTHLIYETSFVVILLSVIFYLLDRYLYSKEDAGEEIKKEEKESIGMEGAFNLILLLGVVGFVLFSGIYDLGEITIYGVQVPVSGIIRDVGLLLLALISWKYTSRESRDAHGFTWEPIAEVAILFAAIFITIMPPLAMLDAARTGQGALQFVNEALFTASGEPNNVMFFWLTGVFSSFLDNAPTYLIFFNAAGGQAQHLMTTMSETLVTISSGAVFFGAVSYIGNAPNFMVKSIAEESGVKMPSFGKYIIWTLGILIPIYILVTFIFI